MQDDPRKVLIEGLESNISELDLADVLGNVGKVQSLKYLEKDKEGLNRAVVTFATASAAAKALPEWNGCKFNDFEVRLSMYKQPSAPTIKEAPAEAPAEEAAVEDEAEEQDDSQEEDGEDVRQRAARLKQEKQKQLRQKQAQRKREREKAQRAKLQAKKKLQAQQKRQRQQQQRRQQQQQQRQKRSRLHEPQPTPGVKAMGNNSTDLFDQVLGPVFQITLNGADVGGSRARPQGRRVLGRSAQRGGRGRTRRVGRGRGRGGGRGGGRAVGGAARNTYGVRARGRRGRGRGRGRRRTGRRR